MRKWLKRGVWISVLAAVLAAGGFVTSYAETRIGNVRLVFSDQLAEGRMLEPDVIGYGAGYEVADVEWSKDVDVWRPGSKVTAEVTLVADDARFDEIVEKAVKACHRVEPDCEIVR